MPEGLVALLVVVALSAPVHADDPRAAAQQHFETGRVAFAAERYDVALAAFRRAYALAPYPDLLFNIARCQERLRQLPEAIDSYERFMVVARTEPGLREHLAELRAMLAARPPPSPFTPPPPRRAAVERRAPRRWWVWTTVGLVSAAAVGIGVGVGLGVAPEALTRFPAVEAR